MAADLTAWPWTASGTCAQEESSEQWVTKPVVPWGVTPRHALSCPLTKDCCLWNSFWAASVHVCKPFGGTRWELGGRGPASCVVHHWLQHPPEEGAGGQLEMDTVCNLWLPSTCTAILSSQGSKPCLKTSLGGCLLPVLYQLEISLGFYSKSVKKRLKMQHLTKCTVVSQKDLLQ